MGSITEFPIATAESTVLTGAQAVSALEKAHAMPSVGEVAASVNSVVIMTTLVAAGGDITSELVAACSGGNKKIDINADFVYSSDVIIPDNDIVITGSGTLTAVALSGADIELTGDRCTYDVKTLGNTLVSANITNVQTSPNRITTDGSLVYTIGDQVIIKTTDSFNRALFVGEVTAVSGQTVTVSSNLIEGSFGSVTIGQVMHLNLSSKYHGAVRFKDCEYAKVGSNFSGSKRDLEFYNVNYLSHEQLTLENANLLYQFCYMPRGGDITSINSRYYGRTIQASKGGSVGDLSATNPLFSGMVIKGCHDLAIGNISVSNAPVMSFQCVDYVGVTPSSVNPLLQSDLLCSNLKAGNLKTVGGNWIAAIKSVDSIEFGDVFSTGAYKSFYGDASWGEIKLKSFKSIGHNTGQGNTSDSSAAAYFRDGESVTCSLFEIIGAETTSANGILYFDNVQSVEAGIYCEDIEQFVQVKNCGDVDITKFETKDTVNGFQLLRVEGNGSFKVRKSTISEGTNDTVDRFIYVVSGSNIDIANTEIRLDGASITPTDGVRTNTTGKNINITNISTDCTNSATCGASFRNTGACSYLKIDGAKALTGVTNAVSVASATNYLQVINTQGNIVDTTGAITNKNVSSGNI